MGNKTPLWMQCSEQLSRKGFIYITCKQIINAFWVLSHVHGFSAKELSAGFPTGVDGLVHGIVRISCLVKSLSCTK